MRPHLWDWVSALLHLRRPLPEAQLPAHLHENRRVRGRFQLDHARVALLRHARLLQQRQRRRGMGDELQMGEGIGGEVARGRFLREQFRSEEHTSELQSLMRISYAVFCLKKKTKKNTEHRSKKHHHKYTHR